MKTPLIILLLAAPLLEFCDEKEVVDIGSTVTEKLAGEWRLSQAYLDGQRSGEWGNFEMTTTATSDTSGVFSIPEGVFNTLVEPADSTKTLWPQTSSWYISTPNKIPDFIWRDSISAVFLLKDSTLLISWYDQLYATSCDIGEPCPAVLTGRWEFFFIRK